LDAHFTETDLQVSVAKSDFFGGTRPTLGVFLNAEVPIFDGSRAGTNSIWPRPTCIKPRTNLLERATRLPEKCEGVHRLQNRAQETGRGRKITDRFEEARSTQC